MPKPKHHPAHPLIGAKIVKVRGLTTEELEAWDWAPTPYDVPVALVLDNGAVVYAASDAAGNRPAVLFYDTPAEAGCLVIPLSTHLK